MAIKYRYFFQLIIVGLLSVLSLTAPNAYANDEPVIAAASSIKFAVQDIAHAFYQKTGRKVRFSFSSSGNLSKQIRLGAPYQLFLSANSAYVRQLQQLQLARTESVIFALGQLVLLTPDASPFDVDDSMTGIRQAIQKGQLQHFSIANPEHAPYGIAAKEVLQKLELWPLIQPRLVVGENVAQAAHFAASGVAQAGLISYSLALVLKQNVRFVIIPQSQYKPLEQTMVLLNSAGDTAIKFYRYMQQDSAQRILADYGYLALKDMD